MEQIATLVFIMKPAISSQPCDGADFVTFELKEEVRLAHTDCRLDDGITYQTQLRVIKSSDQYLGSERGWVWGGSTFWNLNALAAPGAVRRLLRSGGSEQDALNEIGQKWKEMAMGLVAYAVATVGGLVTGVMNFFTDMFLTPPLKATLKYLEETELKTLQGERRTLKAKSLWENSGAVIMAVRRPG